MKKITKITLSLVTFACLNGANAENINTGESIFMQKDRTMPVTDYINSSVNVNPVSNSTISNLSPEELQKLSPEELQAIQAQAQKEAQALEQSAQNMYLQQQQQQEAQFQTSNGQFEMSPEEIALMKSAVRSQNLNALQKKFHTKKYKGYENTSNLNYEENKTQKIRTRFAMATTLIFPSEVQSYVLGDTTGFNIEEIPNLSNAIAIKPLLIGIDTSLTVFTKDKKIHTFYLFSTDYKNNNDPSFIIYINDNGGKKQNNQIVKNSQDYLFLKDGQLELKIKKSDMKKNYIQKVKKENEWLVSEEIFDDKKFTYFKYDKEKMPQIPAIFAVIDKQDSPVETRVIGDYIIAETTNPKFTIKSGEAYVCVERETLKENNATSNTNAQIIKTKVKDEKKPL